MAERLLVTIRRYIGRHHWFVRGDVLTHPDHGEVTVVSRFGRIVAAHVGDECLSPADFREWMRTLGVSTGDEETR